MQVDKNRTDSDLANLNKLNKHSKDSCAREITYWPN